MAWVHAALQAYDFEPKLSLVGMVCAVSGALAAVKALLPAHDKYWGHKHAIPAHTNAKMSWTAAA